MVRPFSVYRGGLAGLGQASTPTSISPYDVEVELADRGYRMQPRELEPLPGQAPHLPTGPLPEPVVHLPTGPPGPAPDLPTEPLPELAVHLPTEPPGPAPHLPTELMPDIHVPYEPASPYARYIRFLPYLAVLFRDNAVLDLGKIV